MPFPEQTHVELQHASNLAIIPKRLMAFWMFNKRLKLKTILLSLIFLLSLRFSPVTAFNLLSTHYFNGERQLKPDRNQLLSIQAQTNSG
ncbi:MAG: hypothetical protein EZS28_017678, partial [Streblomastix strix]